MIIDADETGIIYRILFPNGKSYIGQTKRNVYQRMREHLREYSGCTKLKNALRKYPENEVIASVLKKDIPIRHLDWWENHFIGRYDSIKNGYNILYNDSPAIPLDAEVPYIDVPRHEPKVNIFAQFACPTFVPERKKIFILPKKNKKEEKPWFLKHLTDDRDFSTGRR